MVENIDKVSMIRCAQRGDMIEINEELQWEPARDFGVHFERSESSDWYTSSDPFQIAVLDENGCVEGVGYAMGASVCPTSGQGPRGAVSS
jgi:hypothetical protein